MKTYAFVTGLVRSSLGIACCSLLLAGPVYAQDRNDESGASGRTTIIIEEDGRVIVNGEEVERGASGVLRFDNGGAGVVIVHPERRARIRASGGPVRHFRIDGEGAFGEDIVEDIRIMTDKLPLESIPFDRFEPLLGEAAFIARESAEVIKLEREARELARKARRAEGAEREQLEQELRAKLMETLDAKLEARSERIERLEEHLQEERNILDARRNSREEIVSRRLRELLGEDDLLDW